MDLLSEAPKDLLRMCCGCNKIYLNLNGRSQWIDKGHPMYEDLILVYGEAVTHVHCDSCFEIYARDLQRELGVMNESQQESGVRINR